MYIKWLFLFSLIIGAGYANARKIPKEYKALDNNPIMAKTLAVGNLTEDLQGEKFFNGVKGWTLFPKQFHLRKRSDERQSLFRFGDIGERYLFYSLNNTSENGVLDDFAYFNLLPLKSFKAKELIRKLASRKVFVGEINPSWQFCEADSECVQSKNQCGEFIGVNKEYQKDYLGFLNSKKVKTDCSKSITSGLIKSKESKCVENFCS